MDINRGQVGGVGHRAFYERARGAHAHIGQERERHVGIAQAQHGACLAAGIDGGIVVAAGGFPAQAIAVGAGGGRGGRTRRSRGRGGRWCGRRRCRHAAGGRPGRHGGCLRADQRAVARLVIERVVADGVELCLQLDLLELVGQRQVAACQHHLADIQLPFRRALLGAEVERPVVARIGQPLQPYRRAVDHDGGHGDLVRQQGDRAQYEDQFAYGGEVGLFRPVGIADGDVACRQARPRHQRMPAGLALAAAPGHGQVAIDGKGTADGLGNLVVEPWLEAVPVEGQEQDHQQRDQRDRCQHTPQDDLAAHGHEAGSSMAGQVRWYRPPPRLAWACPGRRTDHCRTIV
ncbi:hypothetical protein D9M72_472860 [compost metagenome]